MAMSRTKSFLPRTQKTLWRTDTRPDPNAMDSVGAGGLRVRGAMGHRAGQAALGGSGVSVKGRTLHVS